MIKILEEKNPKKKVNDPYYLLTYEYMIGDANGHTDGEVELSENNPFIERYCKLLSSLKATKGTWGLCLNCETIGNCFTEKQITEDDYKFLMRTMFPESFEDWEDEEEEDKMMENYFKTEEENNWADEFGDGVNAETEYSFLVFQGIELKYVNEFGKKQKTKFV